MVHFYAISCAYAQCLYVCICMYARVFEGYTVLLMLLLFVRGHWMLAFPVGSLDLCWTCGIPSGSGQARKYYYRVSSNGLFPTKWQLRADDDAVVCLR